MAVNSQKLLPQGNRGGAMTLARPKVSLVKKGIKKDITSEPDTTLVIKTRVIEIEKILKGSIILDKKIKDQERKQKEKSLRAEEEKELEAKDEDDADRKVKKKKSKKKLGFLDGLINFVNNVLMGWVLVRMVDFLPKLKKIIPILGKALDFITGTVIGAVDILGTFLMWGDKAINGSREFTRNLFGDKGVKAFDSLISTIGTLFNVISILGLAAAAFGMEWGNQGGDPTRVKGLDLKSKRQGRRIRFDDVDYLKRLRARYRQRFGKNIPKRFFTDLEVSQPRKPNLLDNLKKNVGEVRTRGSTSIRNRFNQIRSGVTDAFSSAKPKGPNPLVENFRKNITSQYTSSKSSVQNFMELAKERTRNKQNIFTGKPLKKGWSHHIEDFAKTSWKKTTQFTGEVVEGTKKVASQTTDYVVTGTKKNWRRFSGAVSETWSNQMKRLDVFINEGLENMSKKGVINWLTKQDGLLGTLGRKIPAFFQNPIMKKLFKGIPLAGDIIGFLMDLHSGMDWRRAFIVSALSAAVDSLVVSLPIVATLLAPFTGGASLVAGATLLGLYIAADEATGRAISHASGYRHKTSFTRTLGHLLSDYLGIPDSNSPPGEVNPGSIASSGNVEKTIDEFNTLISNDPEKSEVIERLGGTSVISKDFKMGDRTYDLSKSMGGLSQKDYDALSDKDRNMLNKRIASYSNQSNAGVANFKPVDLNSVTNGINRSASYEDGNGTVVIIDNSSNGTGNSNENNSELIVVGGGNSDDSSTDAFYKGD